MTRPRPDAPAVHRRLWREPQGRLLAGVATGLSAHLGVDVVVLRVVLALLTAVSGAGVLLYLAFWVTVPERAYDVSSPPPRPGERAQLVGFAALALVAVLVSSFTGLGLGSAVAWPVVVAAIGGALLWRQADEAQRERWLSSARGQLNPAAVLGGGGARGVVRIVGGVVLLVGGMAGFIAANSALRQARWGLIAVAAVLLGLAVVGAPLLVRMASDLTAERTARIRSQERAEIASRIHDSVLHTLALIQRHADNPREVVRLARAQERDLRGWLYKPAETAPADQLGAALEQAAGEVEDTYGVPVELVAVGDAPLDEQLRAVVQAAREAMVNAAKASGAPTISVYAEVEPAQVAVFVRDRGKGFDLEAVGHDRYGIRESIVGRMQRSGGSAEVRTAPGEGTEVRLTLARRGAP